MDTRLGLLREMLAPHILDEVGSTTALGSNGDVRWATGRNVLTVRSWRWFKYWLWTLGDAFPPYRNVTGRLEFKDRAGRKFYIGVNQVSVEVDRATFDTLALGDSLRVRYTRGNRAINIDCLVSEKGSQGTAPL